MFGPKHGYLHYLQSSVRCFDTHMGQHMRSRYSSHCRAAQTMASVCQGTGPPEPSLLRHWKGF